MPRLTGARRPHLLLALVLAVCLPACSDNSTASDAAQTGIDANNAATGGGGTTGTNNTSGSTTDTGASAGASDAGAASDAPAATDVFAPPGFGNCSSAGPACNNCIDDDGDGLIDGLDPHCISGLDNDEASFATGIPGDNRSSNGYQDCFFDGNSGSGNDGCRIANACILGSQTEGCEVTQQCLDSCLDLTRQGCDCFGCCTMCNGTSCRSVVVHPALAPDCTLENLDDPTKCPPCQLNEQCSRPCEPENCKICPGQTVEDLPASCNKTALCDAGFTACQAQTDCAENEWCSLGCCLRIQL